MPFLAPISACLFLLVALGLAERFWRDRAWRAVPIRIHVNGTRGKSSVTRMIWAALRAAGIPALAKTTGAAACLLLPDGTERPLRRRGKPNIREQLRTLWLARRSGARAVVLECMAIAPELQWTAEQSMTRASIGVITNVRTDHTEVMGRTLDEIAGSLANTIPHDSVLVVGEARLALAYKQCAAERRSKLILADAGPSVPESAEPVPKTAACPPAALPWQRENEATALAVTRQLGIKDEVALGAICSLRTPAGDDRSRTLKCGSRSLAHLDARKANDPESFLRVWSAYLAELDPARAQPRQHMLIYNHRSDRPHRLLSFASGAFPHLRIPEIVITGQRPAQTLWLALRRLGELPRLRFVPQRQLPALLAARADCHGIVFCGNIHGLDLARALPVPETEA